MKVQKKGKIFVDGKQRYPITADQIVDMRMGVVSYSGQGKYTPESQFFYWDELPEDRASVEAQGEAYRWPTRDGSPPKRPEGHGWWPVLVPRFREGALHHFWQATSISGTLEGYKRKGILVVCFYQILDDQIVGWWVFIDVARGTFEIRRA